MTGSLEHGKLGLGESQRSGLILRFTKIPKLSGMSYLAIGPNHMIAIQSSPSYHLLSWGLNTHGQLGLGNLEHHSVPKKLHHLKDKFQKIVCGWNFTIALTEDWHVYYWGNYRYHGGATIREDVLVPTPLKSLEGRLIKDIACNRHQCYALNDKGEIF